MVFMKFPDGGLGGEKVLQIVVLGSSGAVSAWPGFAALAGLGSAWPGLGWLRSAQLRLARAGLSRAWPSPDPISIGLRLTPLGSAWCCPARFDSAWLGLACPGLAQIGSAWLGPRRSGDGQNFVLSFSGNLVLIGHSQMDPSSSSSGCDHIRGRRGFLPPSQ